MTSSLQPHELQHHSSAKLKKKKKALELSNSAKDGLRILLHPLKIPILNIHPSIWNKIFWSGSPKSLWSWHRKTVAINVLPFSLCSIERLWSPRFNWSSSKQACVSTFECTASWCVKGWSKGWWSNNDLSKKLKPSNSASIEAECLWCLLFSC